MRKCVKIKMADRVEVSSKNSRALSVQRHDASSSDLLCGNESSKRRKVSRECSLAERLISKRISGGTTQYLAKWLNCSSFENSWEAEGNLTHDLVRHFDNPIVQPERLIRAVDTLRVSVLNKLKNGSFGDVVIDFDHDCFRKLFYGKGREANDRGYVLLEKEDFVRCQLPENWDFVCDIHGDGVRVEYPFKVRPFLAKSPKTFHLIGGKLVEGQRMLIEKLSLDFIWQAVALLP